MFTANNQDSFRLWSKKNLVKHQKVSKYYCQDCTCTPLPANRFPNNILRNLPVCSLASFSIVSLAHFDNKPDYSRDLTIFMISCTFSFEIINAVVPGTKSLF